MRASKTKGPTGYRPKASFQQHWQHGLRSRSDGKGEERHCHCGKRYCRTSSKGVATVSVKRKVQYSEQDGPIAHRSRAISRSEQSRKSVYCNFGVVYIIAQGLELHSSRATSAMFRKVSSLANAIGHLRSTTILAPNTGGKGRLVGSVSDSSIASFDPTRGKGDE